MSTFSVISGASKASRCNIKADKLQLVSGIFSSEDVLLAGVRVSTDGLVPPNPKLVRFYLRHGEREWLCEATTSVFAELQAMLYKFNNPSPHASSSLSLGKPKTWAGIFGATLLIVVLASTCNKKDSSLQANPNMTSTAQKPPAATPPLLAKDKIGTSVLDSYTKAQFPKTFAKFGSRMSDVEKARKASALLAAKSDKCLKVEMSEVSDKSPSRNDIHTYVDCTGANGQNERFRFAEAELKDKQGKFFTVETITQAGKPATMTDQSLSHDAAISICKSSVASAAKFPSSVKFSWTEQIVRTSDASGETWVELPFEAKNSLGAMLPQKATCIFPITGKPTIKIENR